MTVCGLTIGLQWLQMVNGVLNLNIHFWWVLWVCLRGSILEAVYHADDFVVQERTNTSRASAMLLILWVWQNLKRAFTPSTCYICCSMLQVTETGCEVLTARLPSSPDVFPWLKKPWWGTPWTATRKWYWYTGSAKNLFTLHQSVKAEIFKISRPQSEKHATAEQSQQLSILRNYFWECVLFESVFSELHETFGFLRRVTNMIMQSKFTFDFREHDFHQFE